MPSASALADCSTTTSGSGRTRTGDMTVSQDAGSGKAVACGPGATAIATGMENEVLQWGQATCCPPNLKSSAILSPQCGQATTFRALTVVPFTMAEGQEHHKDEKRTQTDCLLRYFPTLPLSSGEPVLPPFFWRGRPELLARCIKGNPVPVVASREENRRGLLGRVLTS